MRFRYILAVAIVLGLLGAAFAMPGIQIAGGPVEQIYNGSFEEGFYATPAGRVAHGWQWFHNGGQATYGFYDETWTPVLYDGAHGQMIEINTLGLVAADADRYAGIYQRVAVASGETYELTLHGMLRALADDPDRSGYNYRVEYGIDYGGGTDWAAVDNWVEIPWDTVHPRLAPGDVESYNTTVTATGPQLTLFVRAWKKWGTTGRELDVNLDGISLRGAMPAGRAGAAVGMSVPFYPVAGQPQTVGIGGFSEIGVSRIELYVDGQLLDKVVYETGLTSASRDFTWTPAMPGSYTLRGVAYGIDGTRASNKETVVVGESAEFIQNGSFEAGFHGTARGVVGIGWGSFENGGLAEIGFYDDTWPPIVYDGEHAQLIEINTYGRAASEPDRYAGIYQTVAGLTPGATYALDVHGMIRAVGDEGSGYNYRVEWGYDAAAGTDWTQVDNWIELPWDEVYPRLSPGEIQAYKTTFEAPAERLTLFFRAWKKWATLDREVDVNLDGISLTGYR